MTATLPDLDLMRVVLRGSQLIEASAGTGKTYTLAALYLRLVLGQGDADSAFVRPLAPDEILVVTYTDAATAELRERIRARLVQAAAVFGAAISGGPAPACDGFLSDLLDSVPPTERPAAAARLTLAAEAMDEAMIATIHGFCARMLSEMAFEYGGRFALAVSETPEEHVEDALREYWRRFVVTLPAALGETLLGWYGSPEALGKELRGLIGRDAVLAASPASPARALDAAASVRKARVRAWRAELASMLDDMIARVEDAKAQKTPRFNARLLSKTSQANWFGALQAWCRSDDDDWLPTVANLDGFTDTARARLSPDGIADVSTHGPLLAHPGWAFLDAMFAEAEALDDGRSAVRAHALGWLRTHLEAGYRARAEVDFDGMLRQMRAAVCGPHGEALCSSLRTRLPVALIDEFQDTDRLQADIFDAIYGFADNRHDSAVLLIGDPKQSIYRFRGADIGTYLGVRSACNGRVSTLGTNFRASTAMVGAVNAVFAAAEAAVPGAAFGYGNPSDPDGNPMPFRPVAAQGRAEVWEVDGAPAAALSFWTRRFADGEVSRTREGKPRFPPKDLVTAEAASACATEIARLLNLGALGKAGFRHPDGGLRALVASDCAVLVRTGKQADAMRRALAARQIRSVYLSERRSIYGCDEAVQLQVWLAACADPQRRGAVLAALATPLLRPPLASLAAANDADPAVSDAALGEASARFRTCREIWLRQGVLAMLRWLLHQFGVIRRLLASADAAAGERSLSNLLQLGENLQRLSEAGGGIGGLLRRYRRCLAGDEDAGHDAAQMRLESDEALLKIVTVYKSKGLEYPLVFLPFATDVAQETARKPYWYQGDDARPVWCFEKDAGALARANDELLLESVRLAYVALTRARHATWVGLTVFDGCTDSGMGRTLQAHGQSEPNALAEAAEALAASVCNPQWMVAVPFPTPDATPFRPPAQALADRPARAARSRPEPRWTVSSFSALARHVEGPDSADELTDSVDGYRVSEGEAGGGLVAGDDDAAFGLPAPGGASDAVVLAPDDLAADPGLPWPPGAAALADTTVIPGHGEDAAQVRRTWLHRFPRGAAAGSFLHALLEAAATAGFASLSQDRPACRALAAQVTAQAHRDEDAEALGDWLQSLLLAPLRLPGGGRWTLAGCQGYRAELEFWLRMGNTDIGTIDRAVCAGTVGGQARGMLAVSTLNGMLKGFVDLVCCVDGRYYVVDYKSNWLGADSAAYHEAALTTAVLGARYDLQYSLYLLALHRLLRQRLPGYDPARHLGGAVYLFLRGVDGPAQGCFVDAPDAGLMAALDRGFAGGEAG